jgi:Rps23 Pro-64 3,4-dihydroxylase Tpa1-like proline 4-hydroxylase
MKISESLRRQFDTDGMSVIEDAFPPDTAEALRARFEQALYERIDQVREHHYEHVFKTESPYLPKAGEPYLARFWRSRALESDAAVAEFYARQIRPVLQALSGVSAEKPDLRAYKMTEGDHQRVHIDEYAGAVGFIYYMSKGWKWDWGGLLLTGKGDGMTASLPRFNQLIVLNHALARPPHCVTSVAPFAREPRYMLVGFAGKEASSS